MGGGQLNGVLGRMAIPCYLGHKSIQHTEGYGFASIAQPTNVAGGSETSQTASVADRPRYHEHVSRIVPKADSTNVRGSGALRYAAATLIKPRSLRDDVDGPGSWSPQPPAQYVQPAS
jgi:hypothetical protein